jgi:crossover junction endodeoxyribonuclease RuvC
MGVDPSLTGTGLAAWGPADGWATGTIVTKGSNTDTEDRTHLRLRLIVGKVLQFAYTTGAGLVVIESPTYSSNTGHARDRSGLFWLMYDALVNADLQVAVVKANTRIRYALGKGAASKDTVLARTVRLYPDAEIRNNNEADAVLLAAMGCRWAEQPCDGHTAHRLDAVRRVVWPARRL